jgi:hypothetical protein
LKDGCGWNEQVLDIGTKIQKKKIEGGAAEVYFFGCEVSCLIPGDERRSGSVGNLERPEFRRCSRRRRCSNESVGDADVIEWACERASGTAVSAIIRR